MKLTVAGTLACVVLAGCGNKNIDSLDAVKQGVLKDVSKNVNIAAMDVNVVSVSFRDKEADAVVSFAPKGGTPQQGLTMQYTMERKGDEWHIKSRAQSDMQKHAAQAGQGVAGEGSAEPQALPPGHPAMNSSPK